MDIIIIVIIILVVKNILKNNKNKKKGNKRYSQTISTNPNAKTGNEKVHSAKKSINNAPPANKNSTTINIPKNMGEPPSMEQMEGESTTDYLNRKAMQDQKEHHREELEQKIAEKKNYGYITYAGRWMVGDPVPKNKYIVKCGYCGAENLVSHSDKQKLNCYFCREEL